MHINEYHVVLLHYPIVKGQSLNEIDLREISEVEFLPTMNSNITYPNLHYNSLTVYIGIGSKSLTGIRLSTLRIHRSRRFYDFVCIT